MLSNEQIIPQLAGYLNGSSAIDFALNDVDVMGVYLMSMADPNNLLPNQGASLPNQQKALPNFKENEKNYNITSGLDTPIVNYSLANFHGKKNTKLVYSNKQHNQQLHNDINKHLNSKNSKKINTTENKKQSYTIGNATISRTSKHKSKRDEVRQFIEKYQ